MVTRKENRFNYDVVYTDSSNENYSVYNRSMIPLGFDYCKNSGRISQLVVKMFINAKSAKEMGLFDQDKSSWYQDAAAFVTTEYDGTWFARGGTIVSNGKAGLTAYTSSSGAASALRVFDYHLFKRNS